jgi:hypothetical protein
VFGIPVFPPRHCPSRTEKGPQPCPREKLESSFATRQGWTRPRIPPASPRLARDQQGSLAPSLISPAVYSPSSPDQLCPQAASAPGLLPLNAGLFHPRPWLLLFDAGLLRPRPWLLLLEASVLHLSAAVFLQRPGPPPSAAPGHLLAPPQATF